MRTHRINMNLLVDHNHRAFLSNVARFVEQINNVAHINLFLTDLMYAKLNVYTSYIYLLLPEFTGWFSFQRGRRHQHDVHSLVQR